MRIPVCTVSRRLLIALVAVTWLGPVLFWSASGKGGAQPPENQVILDRPADSYYSISDRRCYALVYTDTVHVSHSLRAPPVNLRLIAGGQLRPITQSLPAGQTMPVSLQPGKQVLAAKDCVGHQATLGVFYLSDVPALPPTRTLVVSLSDLGATATYMAEAPVESIPSDFDDLSAGEIEPGLFIKRVFYPSAQPGPDLSRCNQFPITSTTTFTSPMAFTSGELSTIHPPDISVADGVVQVVLEASVSGWRYDRYTPQRLLGVSPAPDGFTRVTLLHSQGTVRKPDPFPTSWGGHELVWVNPAAPISLAYNFHPPPTTTAEVRNLAQALIQRLRPALDMIGAYHFFFSLLTTLAAPLLPLAWLWRLRKRDLADVWPRLMAPVRLGVLMWLGPLGAMFLSFAVYGGSLSHASAALWVAVWCNGLAVSLLSSPATVPSLAARVTAWTGRRKAAARLGSLLLVAGLAALSLILLINLNPIWRHPLTLPLAGLLLALVSWSLVSTLTGNERGLTIPRAVWIGWAALLVLLAVPLPDTVYLFDPLTGWPVEIGRCLFLLWGIFALPYLGLLGSLFTLKKRNTDHSSPSGLSQLMFVFLVGFTGAFPQMESGGREAVVPYLFSPVPFILAWLLFRVIARPAISSEVGTYVFKERKELLSYAIGSASTIRDVVLDLGPQQGDWDNGRLGARCGLILGGALALFYGVLLLPSVADQLNTPFLPLMMLVVFVLPIFLRWVLSAFFLGYFFTHLAGRSGAMKGFSLACAIAASVFAYDLLFRVRSGADFQIFFAIDVVLTVLGLMALGTILDYHTIRQAGYTWQQLLALYRVPYLAGYMSTLLAAVSSTIIGLINGRVIALTANLVDAILRTSGG